MTGQVQFTYQRLGGCLIVRLAGEIDVPGARVLRDTLVAKVSDGDARLVVDLSRVVAFDGAGLPALLAAQDEAVASGGSLRLVGVGPSVRKVLHTMDEAGALVVDTEMSDALEATMEAAGSPRDRRLDARQ
ncbi:MAG TPA: STAS domain-containing protein [Jiangellaceae bacterium]|jgi:anti-sigma B factor antagonist|nr:STAS domain-containing protein [Jiangellaceae bacterium]